MTGGGRANDPAFSMDLTRSRAIFSDPEILYIIHGTCCTSQGDPDSSFPYGHEIAFAAISTITVASLPISADCLRPIVARLAEHRKTLLNIVKHYETHSEIVFQEQSYSSPHSGRSSAWDRFRGNINGPCASSPISAELSPIPAALSQPLRRSAVADPDHCATH